MSSSRCQIRSRICCHRHRFGTSRQVQGARDDQEYVVIVVIPQLHFTAAAASPEARIAVVENLEPLL